MATAMFILVLRVQIVKFKCNTGWAKGCSSWNNVNTHTDGKNYEYKHGYLHYAIKFWNHSCIQTAAGESVGRLQTLTCNKELENILKTSQNTQFILN